ncbi:MAG: hypothetical protein J6W19_07870 [Prevotella sp.]|nr:hypothetical protein [Prevotella sp.]
MKKTILMSLFATLLSVFTASAQSNTYSIIIKMQNGTVFTIGPNEADSIYFDDGKLTVSGKSIEAIEERVGILESAVSSVMAIATKNSNDINENKKDILSLSGQTNKLEKEQVEVKRDVQNALDIANSNSTIIGQIQQIIEVFDSKITFLEQDNKELKAKIETLEKIVSDLQNK